MKKINFARMVLALALMTTAISSFAKESEKNCKGFSVVFNRVTVKGKVHEIIIDKTCKYSEGLGAVWSYGIDTKDIFYNLESTELPEERKEIEKAIMNRLECGSRGDLPKLKDEIIPSIDSDPKNTVLKIKNMLLNTPTGCD